MASLVGAASASAEIGVSAKEITFGTVSNLYAVTPGVAEEFNAGITAYLTKINRAGGIHGRKLQRRIYDDGYDPDRTVKETQKLINQDHVFALIGYGSTPGLEAILDLVNKHGIPVIAPYSGADFLRHEEQKHIFNVKSGYTEQVATLAKLAVYSMGIKSVCVFYQQDVLGLHAFKSATETLQKYNSVLKAKASYPRNSTEVASAVRELKAAGCEAIIMGSQDRQAKFFLKAAHEADFHPLYLCMNLIGTEEFLSSVKDLKERIYIAMVTPLPAETAYPLVKQFREEIKSLNPKASITANTLEGYMIGALLEANLKRVGRNLTRAKFEKAFASMDNLDVGGLKFTFDKVNRQASNRVLVAKGDNGELALMP